MTVLFGIAATTAGAEAPIQFSFTAERIELPAGQALEDLRVQGSVSGEQALQWTVPELAAAGIEGSLRGATGSGSGWRIELDLQADDTRALNVWLSRAESGSHHITGGSISLAIEAEYASGTTDLSASATVSRFSMEGTNVTQDLDAVLQLSGRRRNADLSFEWSIEQRAGAVYIEPGLELRGVRPGFFLEAAKGPIRVAGAAERVQNDGDLLIRRIEFDHAGVGELNMHGALRPLQRPMTTDLQVTLEVADLGAAYATYVQPLMLGTSFDALEATGSLAIDFSVDERGIKALRADVGDVYLDDQRHRFSLFGASGSVVLSEGDAPTVSELEWEGASFYRVDVGAGAVGFTSSGRSLSVSRWQDLPIMDGVFRITDMSISALGSADARFAVSGELAPISLEAITHALDWPIMQGEITGVIPSLIYHRNRVSMEGALLVQVFGGAIAIREFSIDDLWSSVPRLHADIDVNGLDLAQLTATMSFGNMQGTLHGYVRDLELAAWRPVSFDALLATPEDDPAPHRISRQAVDNLGRLSGGASSALSSGWLRLLPQYSYGRLGLACRMQNGFCELNGVSEAPGGTFYVLTRGGLLPPWIEIRGSGRMVRWSALVDGMREIATREMQIEFGARRND